MYLYVTGPLFTPYHQAFHNRNVQLLTAAGHDCFMPSAVEQMMSQSETMQTNIFQVDLGRLSQANAIIVLLDDPDVSSGAACELGIFYEMTRHDPNKLGILGLLTDDRPRRRNDSHVGESLNFFTLGCVLKIGYAYSSIGEILGHLAQWQRKLNNHSQG